MSSETDIVLVSINARYSHTGLGARFLLGSMEESLRRRTRLLEFTISDSVEAMAARILECRPILIGLGVYIWNRTQAEALVACLKREQPSLKIILGGPEISYDTASELAQSADCVVRGEGECLWPAICRDILTGRPIAPLPSLAAPDLGSLPFPDAEYSDDDLLHRNIYIEASRGCPHACDFCLSSVETGVRHFAEPEVFRALQRLMDRGCFQFRFVDRSFNLGGGHSLRLLTFFLERLKPEMLLHFEMTPDAISPALRALLVRFPPGVLHLEAGIQSFNPDVLARINRRCDLSAAAEGIAWLVREAHADVHADLIAGLPGETLDQFAAGFDRLYRLGPSEIQVGILKKLHGTALQQHEEPFAMRFRKEPPYEVLETGTMTPADLEAVRRFAAHWDRVVNRAHFPLATTRLLCDAASPWHRFDALSRRLADQHGLYGFGLVELAHSLFDELVNHGGESPDTARSLLREDYLADGRRIHLPAFLR